MISFFDGLRPGNAILPPRGVAVLLALGYYLLLRPAVYACQETRAVAYFHTFACLACTTVIQVLGGIMAEDYAENRAGWACN